MLEDMLNSYLIVKMFEVQVKQITSMHVYTYLKTYIVCRRIYWTDNKLDVLETSDYFGLKRYFR